MKVFRWTRFCNFQLPIQELFTSLFLWRTRHPIGFEGFYPGGQPPQESPSGPSGLHGMVGHRLHPRETPTEVQSKPLQSALEMVVGEKSVVNLRVDPFQCTAPVIPPFSLHGARRQGRTAAKGVGVRFHAAASEALRTTLVRGKVVW